MGVDQKSSTWVTPFEHFPYQLIHCSFSSAFPHITSPQPLVSTLFFLSLAPTTMGYTHFPAEEFSILTILYFGKTRTYTGNTGSKAEWDTVFFFFFLQNTMNTHNHIDRQCFGKAWEKFIINLSLNICVKISTTNFFCRCIYFVFILAVCIVTTGLYY